MSTTIHLVVPGRPVSFQSRTRALREWKQKVASVARARVARPPFEEERAVSITHYYRIVPRYDTDNMSKAICDALSNIVYRDDWQIAERLARRVPLNREVSLGGMPRELVLALCEGVEFVFIRIRQIAPRPLSEIGRRLAMLWPS